MFYENKNGFYENNEVDLMEIYKYLPKLDCKKLWISKLLIFCYNVIKR